MQASKIQESRNRRLLISLSIMLLCLAGFYVLTGQDGGQVDPTLFQLDESMSVDRVLLESKEERIDIRFDGTNWRVNEIYKADRQMVTVLFATVDQVVPRRPVAQSIRDSISQFIKQNGVRVSFYEGESIIRQFEVGGNDRKTEGWFQAVNGDIPYVMTIPGYRVYVSGIFELNESGWRDKRIFDFNWMNFKSLTATVKEEPDQSFFIQMQEGKFGIEGIEQVDTAKLNTYLDAVSLIEGDQFVPTGASSAYDSLLGTEPLLSIEVTDVGNRTYPLALYPPIGMYPTVLGDLGDELILISREQIQPLVKKKDFFRIEAR